MVHVSTKTQHDKIKDKKHTNKHIFYVAESSQNTKNRKRGHHITPKINIHKCNVCSEVNSLNKECYLMMVQ
jgi:hypothetical protein